MAPFNKRKSQGWHSDGTQETSGRSSDHRSGRFKGTVNMHSAQPSEVSLNKIDQPMEAEDSSITEGDSEAEDIQIKPYNALLQSLAVGTQSKQPPYKKRKVNPSIERSDIAAVYEIEDSEASEVSDLLDIDEKEIDEDHDPFMKHVADPDEVSFATKIEDIKKNRRVSAKITTDPPWSVFLKIPASSGGTSVNPTKLPRNVDLHTVKQKFRKPAAEVLSSLIPPFVDLASIMFGYQDVLFPHRTPRTAEILRKLSCLHFLNHVMKTRDRVIKNNSRISNLGDNNDIEIRDQGFTRPKVLVVLPTRQSCVKYVDTIISFCDPEQQENKKKFQDSYMQGDENFSHEKPEDFRELFGGNDDDMCLMGMKLTRKAIKYFSQFYNSDIIFASPLGLRMAIQAETSKKPDYDFLSSIEIVIADQSDALAMQNWEHMEFIFKHLNLQPKDAHNCDFSRVRNWYLDNNAKFLRQTILISAFNFPLLNSIYTHYMLNVAGKAKFTKEHEGAMLDLGIQVKQKFSRFEAASPTVDPDQRFSYFVATIAPVLKKYSQRSGGKLGVLIYIPIYADFVRIRNYLATSPGTQSISFGSISEYSTAKDVARARSHFYTGNHSILLYTERAHHFRRYHIRGVKAIIMYGLPENPIFYKEVVGGFLGSSMADTTLGEGTANVQSLFSRLDVLKLERIVGTKRCPLLLQERGGDVFDFI